MSVICNNQMVTYTTSSNKGDGEMLRKFAKKSLSKMYFTSQQTQQKTTKLGLEPRNMVIYCKGCSPGT